MKQTDIDAIKASSDRVNKKNEMKIIYAVVAVIALLSYLIGEHSLIYPLITLVMLAIYILYDKLPKVMMFITYHTILFWFVWFMIDNFWLPMFRTPWGSFAWDLINLDSIRVYLFLPLTYGLMAFGAFLSIMSAWSSTKLKETEIGQLVIFNWMPKWGGDLKNSWYGIFTGLPEKMVAVKNLSSVSQTVKENITIQIEIPEDPKLKDPEHKKYAAVFDFTFKWKIVDTYTYITNKSEVSDLMKLVEKALTKWLNDDNHNYEDIAKIKVVIKEIEEHIAENLIKQSIELYGIQISNFLLVDIELPAKLIEQQVQNKINESRQIAADEREMKDTDAYLLQVAKVKAENPSLTEKEVLEEVRKLRGITKSSEIKGGGKVQPYTKV